MIDMNTMDMRNMIFTVKSAIAPLQAQPNDQTERVEEVLHGKAVSTISKKNDWLYVRTSYRYTGWVHRCHLYPYLYSEDMTNLTSAQIEPKLPRYISVPSADVLAAPKVQAPLLICLALGGTVHAILGKTVPSGWTQIALADDRIGYIRSTFLSPFPIEATPEAICQTAKLYLGTQYRWGGKTPLGIDCSGLCFMAYWLNGVSIYRDARIAPGFPIKKIPPAQAQKGDLLFFPGHVGMLLDEDTMIHSSEVNSGVKIEPLTPEWKARITAVGSIYSSTATANPLISSF